MKFLPIMKSKTDLIFLILAWCIVVSLCFAAASCVALLRAEKLVYSGSIAKKPVAISSDSTDNVRIEPVK